MIIGTVLQQFIHPDGSFFIDHLDHFSFDKHNFLCAIQGEPLDVTVLGWLYSQPEGTVVMAGRVTAVVPKQIRQRAVTAIQQDQSLMVA